MATARFDFPKNFLWGTATAAHQVEGGNTASDLWLLEMAPDSAFAEPSGDACDHYHRYAEDIALLAGLAFPPIASPSNGRGSSRRKASSRKQRSIITGA